MRNGEDSHDVRHRTTVKHGHEPGDLHELTFSCDRRWPLLTSDDRLELLARQIDLANQACRMELVAFVFMPEHVHLLVNPLTSDPQIDKYLAMIKQPVSSCVRKRLKSERNQLLLDQLTVHERPGKLAFRFWQEGPGFDRNLFTQQAILGSLNYIHENPVERGLCAKAVDWKWSRLVTICRDHRASNSLRCHSSTGFHSKLWIRTAPARNSSEPLPHPRHRSPRRPLACRRM